MRIRFLSIVPFHLLTFFLAGLIDEISLEVYEALAHHVSQAGMNRQRMKTVSWWSLQVTANAIMSALKNVVDPVSVHLKEVYSASQSMPELFNDLYIVPDV